MLIPLAGWAQHELPTDTLRRSMTMPSVKHFGDYLLDMKLLNASVAPMISLHAPLFEVSPLGKNYGSLFNADKGTVFAQGFTNAFSYRPVMYYDGWGGYGIGYGLTNNTDMLQKGSFRLNNGMRLNVYGQRSADGRLLPGMNVLPWQKNDFKGAFELRSASGHFGVTIEVSRENPGW
jgi:hypothetical protein